MNSHKQYLDLYNEHHSLLNEGSIAAMNAHRQAAADLLAEQGLPSHKEERYKYTNADEAFAPNFGLNLRRIPLQVNPYVTFKCNVPNLSTSLFFVLNDTPYPAPDNVKALLPESVVVDSFRHVAQSRPELLEAYYHQAAANDRDFRSGHDGVTLLNTLLAQDGLFIYLPEGTEMKAPLQIVNIA